MGILQLAEKILNGDDKAISELLVEMDGEFTDCNIGEEERILPLLNEAIQANNSYAMLFKALFYLSLYRWVRRKEAIDLLDRAIQLNNPYAMNTRANMYLEGIDGGVNYSAAILLYERAIELGNYFALTNRGKMHEKGFNYSPAIEFYDRAIQLGDTTWAKFYRACLYENGLGGAVDKDKAAKLYRGACVAAASHTMVRRRARKNLLRLQQTPDSSIEVNYYAYMVFLNNALLKKISIYDFINLLAQDDLLSPSERLKYADKAFNFYQCLIPSDASNFSDAARELIGEYNYEKASFLLRQCPFIQNAKDKQQTFERALSYLANIPKTSKIRGEAVTDMGFHYFQMYKETNLNVAIAKAHHYLREGIDLGNENAEMYYRRSMELVLAKEKIDDELPLEELTKAYKRKQKNSEILTCLDSKIKSYRGNLFFGSADAKVTALTHLKESLEKADVNESYADIINEWECKNRNIISTHRNIFLTAKREKVQTNTQLFIAELVKRCVA